MLLVRMTKLLGIAAVLGCTALAGSAHAYSIRIDCHGTNDIPSWNETSNTITIETKINNVWAVLCTRTPNSCWSDTNISTFDNPNENICTNNAFTVEQVQQVRFTTNGSNAWFLDEWELYQPGGWHYFYGTDNNTGWCFSTQSSDGNSQHCLGGVAYTSKVWNGGS